jgi:hypothetical protein
VLSASIASLFGIVVGGTLAAVLLGIAGPSWGLAGLMLAAGAFIALFVGARERLQTSTFAHAGSR